MNAEEADPASETAGRPRQDGGTNANIRIRASGGNFCFESGGFDYRDGGRCGGGGR